MKGLYRGFLITAFRDIPGWAIYFSSYEKLKLIGKNNIKSDKLR
jgi:hypothetical protein